MIIRWKTTTTTTTTMTTTMTTEFAPEWDAKYIAEVKAAKSFPKAILSSYPPGFTNFGQYSGGSPGTRLCTCQFSNNDVENHIIRINTGGRYKGDEPYPTQIAIIAAGFFFARAEFLIDVPFDPFVPWYVAVLAFILLYILYIYICLYVHKIF